MVLIISIESLAVVAQLVYLLRSHDATNGIICVGMSQVELASPSRAIRVSIL